MIEILHILGSVDAGGVETLLTRFYLYTDKTKYHWNFIVPVADDHKIGLCELKLREMGCNIYYIPRKIPTFRKHLLGFCKILSQAKFDIIHCHNDELAAIYLTIAKSYNIKIRIAHCHIAHRNNGIMFELISTVLKPIVKYVANSYFACSQDAGEFMFGKKPFFILHNAFELDKYKFSITSRSLLRKKLDVSDNIVIGCVGRFDYQKNHIFLINVFNEIVNLCKNAKLLLIGTGILEKEIREKINSYNLNDRVIFTGVVDNVEDYLCAMDYFVLPSRFEGLGIVYIESLASDLPTFAPFETVPHEIALTPNMHFISNQENGAYWAKTIINTPINSNRKDVTPKIGNFGYEIQKESEQLSAKYDSLLSKFL